MKVPNCACVPNLTLSVWFGHTNHDLHFSNSPCVEFKCQIKKLFPTYFKAGRELKRTLFTFFSKIKTVSGGLF